MQQSNTRGLLETLKRKLYFTDDHEWIDFQGPTAYTGVCSFKLKGINAVEKIDFSEPLTIYKAGDIIGSIYYAEYKIDIHIPVAGKILSFNEELVSGNNSMLLQQPEDDGWFAQIMPSSPYDRLGLITSQQYQMKNRESW
jgi:glycine cleavage system H protein